MIELDAVMVAVGIYRTILRSIRVEHISALRDLSHTLCGRVCFPILGQGLFFRSVLAMTLYSNLIPSDPRILLLGPTQTSRVRPTIRFKTC